LIDGRLVFRSFKTFEQAITAGNVVTSLSGATTRRLDGVVLAGVGFILHLNPDTLLAPSVAFVRADRDRPGLEGFFPGAPDLAADVFAHWDRQQDAEAKAQQWLDAGTRLGWIVWPATRSITVHHPDGSKQILHEGDTLTGDDVVPGFECSVDAIFEK